MSDASLDNRNTQELALLTCSSLLNLSAGNRFSPMLCLQGLPACAPQSSLLPVSLARLDCELAWITVVLEDGRAGFGPGYDLQRSILHRCSQ